MAEGKVMGFKPSDELRDQVERYQDRRGFDYLSDAHEELVTIGLREARSPILYRMRDLALGGAWNLAQLAVVVVIVGYLTHALSPGNSILIAAVLLSVAAGLIASTELVRALGGHSHLSRVLRREVSQ